ncbi:hypothetical protein L596_020970 [Steinernema carpocapsae]|uniref:Hydroxysteroid dehydrogenase-like protein 2 n=1 Tax=Steinernema carpocapsae TaxID=34508 RepID=A0A4U5MV19_STECR|nr:hypothetical protein L596_020970 [Steinernema carpocapsae]
MVQNTGHFKGKTAVLSGGSRGIGLAIALKLAKDGANIVICAKTAETHPKLPGTIYSAAKEIEAVGGQCLPCVVDVRDEQAVEKAIDATVKRFGGIDVLINNASAISLTGTLETSMKKYDLMNNINTRGTFLMSQKCLPHLLESENPHILNISPPLNMKPKWFGPHVAYTMAKYGMSMCVLGMHEEFKDQGVAVNALWPRTIILTAATGLSAVNKDEVGKMTRSVEIMADAAYMMLSKNSRKYTGQFAMDDEVLKEAGVTDFSKYSVKPGNELLLDIFVDDYGPTSKL